MCSPEPRCPVKPFLELENGDFLSAGVHAPTTDIKNAISYHKNIRLGFDSPSRLFFHYIVFRILHVLTRVCVYPHAQTSAAQTAHRGRLWKVGWSDNHHQRRVRKGVCTYVAIAFLNAAMIFFSPSNVGSADWVKRHACGLPTAAAVMQAIRWIAARRHTSCGFPPLPLHG